MALRQRTVTGTLVDGDGNPLTSAVISFKPTKTLGYTSTHVVIDREFTVTTDASDGTFFAEFWCDDDSLTLIDYVVKFPTENSGQPDELHFATISLGYEDGSPKDIGTLIAESQPPPSSVPVATWQSLIDGRIQSSDLDALADVDIDPMTLADGDTIQWDSGDSAWKNAVGGSGGVSIGDAVGSGTAGSVLFVGSGNDLQQDNAGFQYDPSTNSLKLTAGAATDVPLIVKGASGQSANLHEVRDSADTLKAAFSDDGSLAFTNFGNNTKSLWFTGGAGDVGIRWSSINGGGGFANMLSSVASDVFACEIVNTGGKLRLHTNGTSKGLSYYNQNVERWGVQGDTNTMFAFKGADVASASAITPTGNIFHVTGTTNITSITSTSVIAGTTIVMIFDGVLTVTDGSNLKLAGNFTTAANSTLSLVYDGANWYEVSRSTN